jgi:ribosomal protein L7Ae-like RNA K-turn-binding protein
MNNSLGLLGIAKKAGRLEIGDESVGSAARAKKARLILTASDASDGLKRRADHYAAEGSTIHLALPFDKYELGSEVGRGLRGYWRLRISASRQVSSEIWRKTSLRSTAALLTFWKRRIVGQKSESRVPRHIITAEPVRGGRDHEYTH